MSLGAASILTHQTVAILRAGCLRCSSNLNQIMAAASIRTKCTLRRLHPVRKDPDVPLLEREELRRRHFIYSFEENSLLKPQGEMTVILTHDVEGMGMKGDVLTVTKRMGRSILMPAGVAVYASPENLAANQEVQKNIPELERDSVWAQKTVRMLESMHLPIAMSPTHKWTLTKTHVKIAFRKNGIIVSEDAIELPEEPVQTFGPISFHVTVNKKDRVAISGTVYEYTTDDRFRPTEELWNHKKITFVEAVIRVMKKNGLANSSSPPRTVL